MLDGELAGRDDTLGLVADVEQDLVAVDLDDGAFDDVAVVEVLDGAVDRGEEVIGGADVVDRDLRGGSVRLWWTSLSRWFLTVTRRCAGQARTGDPLKESTSGLLHVEATDLFRTSNPTPEPCVPGNPGAPAPAAQRTSASRSSVTASASAWRAPGRPRDRDVAVHGVDVVGQPHLRPRPRAAPRRRPAP